MTTSASIRSDGTYFELDSWQRILESDKAHHVFETPQWQSLWWAEFGAAKELLGLELRADDSTLGLVPLYRKAESGRSVLRFVGGIDLTDYLGPICAPDDRRAVAEALLEWLSETDEPWDELDAHNQPVPAGFAEFLVDLADQNGFDFALDQEETAAILQLPSDWDSYLAGLASKERHELKRKRRRIEKEHPDTIARRATADSLEADMRTFIDMHRGTQGLKGHFMRPEIASFFQRIAADFMERGWLALDLLEIGGRAIASTFSFTVNDAFYLYNSAYEPDVARLSPGLILVSELVRSCIADGVRTFDFMRGPERYKYQLGAQAVPLNNVTIYRESRR
jgi:CelD/BcsL family acetyltransferase involved in cellulose biosynthesis